MKILLGLIIVFVSFTFAQNNKNKISVEKIDKQKLEKIINQRNGKPLFINLWATWCVPCREEFPTINKLVDEYKNIDFIGISIDYPDEVESKIIPFLKSQKAKFVSFVNGFEKDEDLINFLDKDWNGALPATFIFNLKGEKISFLEGKKSYDEFKKEIKNSLKDFN